MNRVLLCGLAPFWFLSAILAGLVVGPIMAVKWVLEDVRRVW